MYSPPPAIQSEEFVMQLTERKVGRVTVIDISGTWTATEDASALRSLVSKHVNHGCTHLVFNLSPLTYLDSAGLGELVACHVRAWRGGCTLKIAGATERTQQLLGITRLLTIFESYATVSEAVASCAAAGPSSAVRRLASLAAV
jgi:anti-sigma B factor antagonist